MGSKMCFEKCDEYIWYHISKTDHCWCWGFFSWLQKYIIQYFFSSYCTHYTIIYWLFSSMYVFQDIEIFDLENFKYNFVNMTAFRIVDSTNTMVRHILSDIERFQPSGYSILNKTYVIQVNGPHYNFLIVISISLVTDYQPPSVLFLVHSRLMKSSIVFSSFHWIEIP